MRSSTTTVQARCWTTLMVTGIWPGWCRRISPSASGTAMIPSRYDRMPTMKDRTPQGDAIVAITEEGGSSAAKLLGDIFERNAREQEWLATTIQSSLEHERDEWKDRALAAEERLHRIESRLFSLLN